MPHTHWQLDTQLGSSLEDHWGLDTLVRVGETWLPRMLTSGAGAGGPGSQAAQMRHSSQADSGGGGSARGSATGGGGASQEKAAPLGAADVPLLKLFEFLTASMCLYVIEERPGGRGATGVWVDDTEAVSGARWVARACLLR